MWAYHRSAVWLIIHRKRRNAVIHSVHVHVHVFVLVIQIYLLAFDEVHIVL